MNANKTLVHAFVLQPNGLRVGPRQEERITKAADLNNDGQVSYATEVGGAGSYVRNQYVRPGANPCQGPRLQPGLRPEDVVRALEARKAVITTIVSQFADQTFDQGRATGTPANYFGGFFDASKRTIKDEIEEIAGKMGTAGKLDQLRKMIEATPRNADGKIDFKIWDAVLFGRLQAELGVQKWNLYGRMSDC